MSLHTTLRDHLKEALKAKDDVRLRTVRGVLTAITNELVATGKTPQDIADDDTVLRVIARLAKQRKDSIEQFEKGGRSDLAQIEKDELVVLDAYLPAMMSQNEIEPRARAKMQELGITDKSKLGMLVGALMKDLKGKADGGDVKAVAERILQ